MSIKTTTALILNLIIVAVVSIISLSFYNQFTNALNERVLLQLTSIKRLKQVQIEQNINNKWTAFINDSTENSELPPFSFPISLTENTGLVDLTPYNPSGTLVIGFFFRDGGVFRQKFFSHEAIQKILLERTGMGSSGESYLVGSDFRLRSQSRFFPDKSPYKIVAKTEGVVNALARKRGRGLFPDYRGINVFSSYNRLEIEDLKWVILSEIDLDEAASPLKEMQLKLFAIALSIIGLVVLLSLSLTNVLTRPLIRMRDYLRIMSKGNYQQQVRKTALPLEIREMYVALSELQSALNGAVNFSVDIGQMKLDKAYIPKSDKDLLGESLENMRIKLLNYKQNEKQQQLETRRMLIERLETERRHLSRELHDGIGPLLTGLKLYVQNRINNPDMQADMKRMLDETIQEVRLMTYSLMPPSLHDFGIGPTLENFVANIQKVTNIDIQFENLTVPDSNNIPPHLQLNVYRIVQELINNTIKHANATVVQFSLSELEEYLSLYYSDNGKGFDPKAKFRGSGLTNINERVEVFNGALSVQSGKKGTTFIIEIPLTHD